MLNRINVICDDMDDVDKWMWPESGVSDFWSDKCFGDYLCEEFF